MNIKENIKELFELETNYAISKETGIAQTTLGRYTSGNSLIGNMKLDHAIKLNNYYIKNKEMLEMKNIIEEIRKSYKVDGENETYATAVESYEDLKEKFNLEFFEEDILGSYLQKVDKARELKYPIIVFDDSNASGGQIFEADELEDALNEAKEHFKKK